MRRLLSFVIALGLLLTGCDIVGEYKSHSETVFGSGIVFSVEALGKNSKKAIKEMSAFLKELDMEINPYNDTKLKAFNLGQANTDMEVGIHCYNLVVESKRLYALTDGAFNIATMPLSRLWNVDPDGLNKYNSFNNKSPEYLPKIEDVNQTLLKCDMNSLKAKEDNGKYYLNKSILGLEIDLGGIAKGYAVDKCREIAEQNELKSAKIDISGNLYFYGKFYDTSNNPINWLIGISEPRPKDNILRETVCAIEEIGDCSVVTSGDYIRYYKYNYGNSIIQDYVYVQHIINPKSGIPVGLEYVDGRYRMVEDYVISTTVIGSSSMTCDSLSTAICVLGIDEGNKLLKDNNLRGIIFTEQKVAISSVQLFKTDVYDGYKDYELYEAV